MVVSEDRNKKSLCETSMEMVANIIKLSSFSIAKKSLGIIEPPSPAKTLQTKPSSDMVVDKPQPLRTQKSVKPKNSPRPTYFLEPNGGNESQYIVHEEKSPIDDRASYYIRKVHQKNRRDLSESSNLLPLPPPPRVVV